MEKLLINFQHIFEFILLISTRAVEVLLWLILVIGNDSLSDPSTKHS